MVHGGISTDLDLSTRALSRICPAKKFSIGLKGRSLCPFGLASKIWDVLEYQNVYLRIIFFSLRIGKRICHIFLLVIKISRKVSMCMNCIWYSILHNIYIQFTLYSLQYNKTYLRILTFKTFRRVIKKFDLAIAPMTPPFETFGTVSLSGDSGPQIASHLQH